MVVPMQSSAQILQPCGQRRATFDFGGKVDDVAYPSLSTYQQRIFEEAFCAQVAKVEDWFTKNGWWQPAPDQPMRFLAEPDTYLAHSGSFEAPFPDLRVLVSDQFRLSESLVPAALGYRGQMQFPAHEASTGEAALAHELTHVFFPNGNRMLAEGLAVYVQCQIGKNPAFPNYGRDLDQMVRHFASRSCLPNLDSIDLVRLDRLSTPTALIMRVGTQYDLSGFDTYPVAGSFIKFLIETYKMEMFHKLYIQTPLVAFARDEGRPDRWQQVYGKSLSELEKEWKASITRPVTAG
jgi:hypothetical protein